MSDPLTRLGGWLESRWAPPVAGLLTIAVIHFVWRSFGEPGVIHDERAYLLQAEIFSHGHWTAPSPPIAAFFEQMHVLINPAVFAKYPPGHALMLVPGMWLGAPGLMPAVLAGVAGALTFWLARRLSNAWIALVTWLLWTTAPATLVWATSYLSENTSVVMWLAAACATVLWLDSGRSGYLTGVAAALAWGYDTRPLTMLALALPLAFVILRRIAETGRWRALALPAVVGVAIVGLCPLWNAETLGDWRTDPYPYYSRAYFPFDKPGFGIDPTPPLRPLPAELVEMDAWSRDVHRDYVPTAVPKALAERVVALVMLFGDGWRLAIALLLLAAAIRARAAVRFSMAAALCLFVAYLTFAHPPGWSVYYFELLPLLHFAAAGELVRLVGVVSNRARNVALALPLAAVALLSLCFADLLRVRAAIDERNAFHRRADRVVRSAPPHSIIFVRYSPGHDPHRALTRNEWDLPSARSWVVYDRGAENARLLATAPDRQAYVLDTSTFQLEPLANGLGDGFRPVP